MFVLVGISHKTASVELREKLSFSSEQLEEIFAKNPICFRPFSHFINL